MEEQAHLVNYVIARQNLEVKFICYLMALVDVDGMTTFL